MDISIILPVYNVEQYLACCIDSILKQDFKGEFEIICVNDGSTDESLQILRLYARENNKIKIIGQKNRGLGAARNVGLIKSQGDYIMFLDSDDYLKHNGVLSLMYEEVVKNKLDFVSADFEYDYANKDKNYKSHLKQPIVNEVMNGRDFCDLGIRSKYLLSVVWNKLYKRNFLKEKDLRFIEGAVYEDVDYTLKAYYLADRVKHIDDVIIMYRQRESSIIGRDSIEGKNRLNDRLIIADSINSFNSKFDSTELLKKELFMYIEIIKRLKRLNNKVIEKEYRKKLKDRDVVDKLFSMSSLKYKVFAVLYLLRIF